MKITGVGAVPLAIPLAPSTPESSWAAGIGKQILVRVTTDSDLIGWGECFAYGAPLAVCNVVDDALAPLVVGQDPTEIERLTQVMHRALMIWGRRGLAMCAVSGVELALWDLAGKSQRVPVHRLLGGLSQPRVRAYASLLRYDTASDVGRMCRAMVGQGYTAIKLHQVDVESVAAGGAEIVQPSVTKVGGLGEMRKIAVLAAAANVTFQPHSFYFGPGLAATVHLCAATPGVAYIEMPPGSLQAPLLTAPIRCDRGFVHPSQAPGLGADPDLEVVRRFPLDRKSVV